MKKKNMYKIGDLPKDMDLCGCKLNGQIIFSGWNKGFWVKNDEASGRIYPVFFENFDEIKKWKVDVPSQKVLLIEMSKRKTK